MPPTSIDPKDLQFFRSKLADFMMAAADYLLSLEGGSLQNTDEQVDSFFRSWRALPPRKEGELPYVGLGIEIPKQEDADPPHPNDQRDIWMAPTIAVPNRLSRGDFDEVAQSFGVDPLVLQAFTQVEAAGSGYNKNGSLKMLFEGQWFWYWLKQFGLDPVAINRAAPTICYPRWTTQHYLGGIAEYTRLEAAIEIHEEAALSSASWGLGQVMGYHWKSLGYQSIKVFLLEMAESELNQLVAIGRYLKVNGLIPAMQAKDWHTLARGYNGPAYASHGYHTKLAQAYEALSRE